MGSTRKTPQEKQITQDAFAKALDMPLVAYDLTCMLCGISVGDIAITRQTHKKTVRLGENKVTITPRTRGFQLNCARCGGRIKQEPRVYTSAADSYRNHPEHNWRRRSVSISPE